MIKLSIILTATIKPAVIGGNFSMSERYEMYRSTLAYYAVTLGKQYNFVFVENSDADLLPLKREFSEKINIEFLQFAPSHCRDVPQLCIDEFDNSRGKGYNEYLMIKKALLSSETLHHSSHFLKITGRYAMINIITMIKEIERRCQADIVYMGDIKDTNLWYIFRVNRISHWGDSRFFVAQVSFYQQYMMNCFRDMCDYEYGKWAEDYFLNFSRQYRKDKRCLFRFRHQVQFNGVSGTINSSQLQKAIQQQDSFFNRLKNEVRHLLRILFPNIWF